MRMAADDAAFRLSARPSIGMVTRRSQASIASRERPFPSLPTAITQGHEKSTRVTGSAALSGTAAQEKKPRAERRPSASGRLYAKKMGRRNTAPMLARSTFGE